MESAALHRAPSPAAATRVALVAALGGLAAGAWALTAHRMAGMDAAPGAGLGGLGWFTVSWAVMMAAMMLPALAPAALAFARGGERAVAAFAVGYATAWTAAGVAAYGVWAAARAAHPGFLAWDRAGRYVAAGVLLVAAAYQLTAAKGRCLDRCRTPRAAATAAGGLSGGVRHAASCIGCCGGLMAALFALGVMNLTWMAVLAALIGAERVLPWRTPAVWAAGAVLAALAIWLVVAPGDVPGLVPPAAMPHM